MTTFGSGLDEFEPNSLHGPAGYVHQQRLQVVVSSFFGGIVQGHLPILELHTPISMVDPRKQYYNKRKKVYLQLLTVQNVTM